MNKLQTLKRSLLTVKFPPRLECFRDYILNYPSYCAKRDATLTSKFEKDNLKYIFDMQEINNNYKRISLQTWQAQEEAGKSSLQRELHFASRSEALNFLNVIKNKCDEIDHHPEWSVQDENLHIKLTSHFLKNNISEKDYELAAFISQKYEDKAYFNFIFNRRNQTWLSNSAALAFALFTFYALSYMITLYQNYRITSRDFLFAKILTAENDYNHERRYKH